MPILNQVDHKNWQRTVIAVSAVAVFTVLCLFLGQIQNIGRQFTLFISLYACLWISGLVCFFSLPKGLSRRWMYVWILVPAVIGRLLLFGFPCSDDVNRYLWEGKMLVKSVNPYALAPDHPSLRYLQDDIWEGINHKNMSAAYPPGVTYGFSLLSRIGYDPGLFKMASVFFDLAALLALFAVLRVRNIDPRWSALYAFNPVVLVSFAGQAHFDSMMVFFMLASLLAYYRRRWVFMFILLALSFQVKFLSLLIVPFLINRRNLKYSWIFVLISILPFVPFLFDKPVSLFLSLFIFGYEMAHNGSVHALLRIMMGDARPATVICGLTFLAVFLVLLLKKKGDPVKSAYFGMAALILLSPTIHIWYLTWVIPFLCIYPSWSWGILCLTLGLYFSADRMFVETGYWHQTAWMHALQWLPMYALLGYEAVKSYARRRVKRRWPQPHTASLIIPALNAQKLLEECLEHIKDLDPAPLEIIVADGGSEDGTLQTAIGYGVKTVERVRGRGEQIAEGVRHAKGDVCIFLHADSFPPKDLVAQVMEACKHNPEAVGGAVGQEFTGNNFRLSFIEVLNDFRASLLGVSFGDQVQFVRTRAQIELNLVPEIPLMEDVELSLRLRNAGGHLYLWGTSIVSNYKWRKGFFRRFFMVIYLMTVFYLRKLLGKGGMEDLYKKYYGA
ncbi:glycosyltransferase [Fibrobacterota bacterium]